MPPDQSLICIGRLPELGCHLPLGIHVHSLRLKFFAAVFFAAGLAFYSELFAVSTGSATTTGHTNKGPTPGCVGCHAADAGVTVAIQGPASLFPGQGATYTVSATKTPNTSTAPNP